MLSGFVIIIHATTWLRAVFRQSAKFSPQQRIRFASAIGHMGRCALATREQHDHSIFAARNRHTERWNWTACMLHTDRIILQSTKCVRIFKTAMKETKREMSSFGTMSSISELKMKYVLENKTRNDAKTLLVKRLPVSRMPSICRYLAVYVTHDKIILHHLLVSRHISFNCDCGSGCTILSIRTFRSDVILIFTKYVLNQYEAQRMCSLKNIH